MLSRHNCWRKILNVQSDWSVVQAPLDPLLDTLMDNGRMTSTHRLLNGSPAIDKGGAALTTDQRGNIRPVDLASIPNALGGDNSDIGTFEETRRSRLLP